MAAVLQAFCPQVAVPVLEQESRKYVGAFPYQTISMVAD